MTSFRETCTECGELNEQHISEVVLIHYGDLELFYRFHCLACGERVEKPANGSKAAVLLAVDVPVIRLNRQYDEAMREREMIDREVEKWSLRLATARVEDFVKA